MPDNYDLPELNPDDNEDELTERRPRSDDLTASMNLDAIRATDDPDYEDEYDPEEDVPFKLPKVSSDDNIQPTVNPRHNPNSMKTMPHFREPGSEDPKLTLPGTGGLDPNPDMMPRVPDMSHSQQTVMNMPKASQQEPPQMTAANPNLSDARFQRPAQQAPRPAQGQHVPRPPQQQYGFEQKKLPPRRGRRSKIFGLPSGCMYMFLGLMVTFCGGLTLVTLGAAAVFIPRIEARWGSQVDQVDAPRFESTFYFDRYGNPLYESFIEGRRDIVNYSDFPQDLIDASVAIEDDTFWSNMGIDIAATGVATLNYLGAGGERVPGGSTITQQTVRNILFDEEYRSQVSVARKVEEIILALFLTQRRSKEDIMTLYLNEIYYGNLAYGAQTAAQTFFGKDVGDLTLGEAALLAGLPQSPANLDPLNPDPEIQARLYDRWRLVLDEMLEEGYITSEERAATLNQGLAFVEPALNNLEAPHFTIYAQNEFANIMINEIGFREDELETGGFRVYTTVDQNINNIALGATRTQVANLASRNVSNASVVIIQPLTGQIIGMVGSIDYNNEAIDGNVNVAIALRQPGSTMKPFTYAAAMELGMTAGDVIWDTPVEIPQIGQPAYVPRNYDGAFHGPMTLRRALANSYNIPAVQTVRLIGVDYLLNMMNRVGVSTLSDPSRYGISLTLGGGEVSLLELTNAYAVFANVGAYVPPTSILCVIDSNDNIVYQYEGGCPAGEGNFTSNTVDRRGFGEQAIDPRIAFTITDILSDNASRSPAMGSNSPLNTPNIGTAVKTGTTNDIKDNWTIGYTRNVVVGVWVGNNNGDPMVNSSGLTGAAPIWNSVMNSIYTQPGVLDVFRTDGQILPDIPNPPQGVSLVQICNVRAVRDGSTGCPGTANEWLLDSPALVPDGNGNLISPQQPLARSDATATVGEISPDIYQTLAYRLNPAVSAGIQFSLQPGDLPPPAPLYCRVPANLQGQATATGAQNFVFIAPPNTSHNDRVRAETWAQQNGYAFLPTIECWDGAFDAGAGGFGSPIVTAVITSPSGGQVVGNPISIIGTVQFDGSQADFWHLDIIGGVFVDWTPMGNEGFNVVNNGELFNGFLDPGSYRVRLRLSKNGQMVQTPYEVSFTVQ